MAVAALGQHQEAHHGGPEPCRHPREQDGEERQHGDLQRVGAVIRQHLGHEVGRQRGLPGYQAEQYPTPVRARRMPFALGIGTVMQRVPGLRHRRAAQHAPAQVAQEASDDVRRPCPRHHRSALGLGTRVDMHRAIVAALDQRLARCLGGAIGKVEAAPHRAVGRARRGWLAVLGRECSLQQMHGRLGVGGVAASDVVKQLATLIGRDRNAIEIALACRRRSGAPL